MGPNQMRSAHAPTLRSHLHGSQKTEVGTEM